MIYVFQVADSGVPVEQRKGCWPAILVFAAIIVVLLWLVSSTEAILMFAGLAVVYLLPLFVLVALAVGVFAVVASIRKPRKSPERHLAADIDVRYLVVDERGITDRFRNAWTRIPWTEVAAVELNHPMLIIQKLYDYPAKYGLASTSVDTTDFASFCAAQIAASQRP